MTIKIVDHIKRSLKIGVVGSGQAGGRLASAMYDLGYPAVCFNTASQDLEFIKLPEDHKILLQYGLGGTSKDPELGKAAANAHRELIYEVINDKLDDVQVLLFCTSLGGGSGAGSSEVMLEIMSATGKPIVVITVLPLSTDDSVTKKNALETLAKLSKLVQSNVIANLIVVDNAKIEAIYADISQLDFYPISNQAIVEPLDIFNKFSALPSRIKGMDSAEFGKLLIASNGLSVYGSLTVEDFQEETAIAEAVKSLAKADESLLANGFDLTQTKYVGLLLISNEKVATQIPTSSVTYTLAGINESCGTPEGVFIGTYIDSTIKDDVVKVYTFFSGLGLPESRVESLRKEVQASEETLRNKETKRSLNLSFDTGQNQTLSAAEKLRQGVKQKKSAFGGLFSASVEEKKRK